jgi:hypothetical protein
MATVGSSLTSFFLLGVVAAVVGWLIEQEKFSL